MLSYVLLRINIISHYMRTESECQYAAVHNRRKIIHSGNVRTGGIA